MCISHPPALVVQAFRSLGLPGSVRERVRVKERQRGYDEATLVESFVILNAAGGECVDDFERLRQDPGLAEMIGHELPSPSAALQFLYAFHAKEKISEAAQRRLPGEIADIPEETVPRAGLGQWRKGSGNPTASRIRKRSASARRSRSCRVRRARRRI